MADESDRSPAWLVIRPSDCDSYGHVNNAVYVSYFEQALAASVPSWFGGEGRGRTGEAYWMPESLTLEYRRPVTLGDTLQGHLWLAEDHRTRPLWGFEITVPLAGSDKLGMEGGSGGEAQTTAHKSHVPSSSLPSPPAVAESAVAAFRAKGNWTRRSGADSAPQEMPADLLHANPRPPGVMPRDFKPPSIPAGVRQYAWNHRVGICEVGPTGHIHPQTLYQWFEEGLFDASAQAGWPPERWLAAGFLTLQTRHDTGICFLPRVGEEILVRSRLIDSRRLGGTWLLEAERSTDGRLIARDYSTGVHLSLDGRPASPPTQITKEIQFG